MEEEDFEFDYEDEEGEEADVDLENKYYNAKGSMKYLILVQERKTMSLMKH
jgi:hypothetical protein